jgi:hypothetical protein
MTENDDGNGIPVADGSMAESVIYGIVSREAKGASLLLCSISPGVWETAIRP